MNLGGAFLSTGSIAWCGCLSYNGYDNNASRITDNVLRRFASTEPESRESVRDCWQCGGGSAKLASCEMSFDQWEARFRVGVDATGASAVVRVGAGG
ncbi:MAG: hypothetical protein QOF33_3502 [Thermomicrobiales bacterium]|nr:hypothetical protein [Thermomicrobiales bacterium]